jgi:hypothetical protein
VNGATAGARWCVLHTASARRPACRQHAHAHAHAHACLMRPRPTHRDQ